MHLLLADHRDVPSQDKQFVVKPEKKSDPQQDFLLPQLLCSRSVLLSLLSAMSIIPFAVQAELTPNQDAVLQGLFSTCDLQAEFSPPLCDTASSIAYGGDLTTLNDIIPDEIAAQGSEAVDFGFRQLSIIHGRIINLRHKNRQSLLLGSSSLDLIGGAAGDENNSDLFRDDPLGFFIKGQFNVGEKDKTVNVQGYKNDRQSMTMGLDYTFFDSLVLGASFGYASTHSDFDSNSGRMDTDAFDFATYGSYFLPKDFYVDWIFSYGLHNFDVNRTVLGNTATARPDGDQYGFSFGLGNDIAIRNFVINPYARFEYLKTDIASYTEAGGGGFGIEVAKQALDSLTTTLGGQASQSISLPWGVLTPGVRAEWVHQYKNNDRSILARFSAADPGTGGFAVVTDRPDRNYFNLGPSLAVTLPEGKSAYLRYEYRLGQRDFVDHTVELGARIPF
ncbi:MAG: autotransporter outer membrane beta-barrel domain-containing protein [Methylococcaceae bacterium]|nr:autotransporter outer membrane beta-barrel domain-containing protein [Methylococcaceae bacterium]